jgi:Fn3 associated/Planctomycete cytochrome C/Leucine rich repeat
VIQIQRILSYINFGLFVFTSVILLFHSHIVLPQWLSIAGRLHPLLVHLPIGIYLLIVILYLLKKKFETNAIQPLLYFTVSISTMTSLLSIIAGLFLALENSYTPEDLAWHKYTAFAFGISQYILYTIFNNAKTIYTHAIVMLSTILLIISGHLGANITHGKNYLFPDAKQVDKEMDPKKNSLFEIAVQPIFQSKCTSCHNAQKSKGGLILTDSMGIKKGGEHGPILMAGNLAESKIIKSMLLPLNDKQHMPPDGKPQLSQEEKNTIRQWILSGASFVKKYDDYKSTDSFKILAGRWITTKKAEKTYTFDKASSATIASLASPYLSIKPLSVNSPALEANFFVSAAFDIENLKKLTSIKEQLVSLNMNNMPLDDRCIDVITQLSKLEKLVLNGCKITDAQFEKLSTLSNLELLSVASNKLTGGIEKSFKNFKSLKQLYINNTSIDYNDIKIFENKYRNIHFYSLAPNGELTELTPPVLENENTVIKKGQGVVLSQFINGATIKYTLDGTDPDSVNGINYKAPIQLEKSATIKAISVKEGWLKSPVASYPLFEEGIEVQGCKLLTNANVQYLGMGERTFINQEKAPVTNLKDPNWIAFREVPFKAIFSLKDGRPIHRIAFCYGVQIPAYVFPPTSVSIYGSTNGKDFKLIKEVKTKPIVQNDKDQIYTDHLDIDFDGSPYKHYKIEAQNVPKIPSWHPGKGERGWLFIDEIFFYE